ncbi:Laccase-4 [Folsomia candida]|uniref:Laccase-4 n=1 Tax=Folsomia candida TaxID=158441 RepID=A0A226D1V5_FOLCA|nr:Laccase-4 [Folsomia candida]
MRLFAYFCFLLITIVSSETATYSLTVSPTTTYPDGVKKDSTLTFNSQFPGPLLSAKVGDRFVITLKNEFSRPTAVHWHGLYQKGSQFHDGPAMVTQCPLKPGKSQTFNFSTAGQAGTFWYHGHYRSQYTDGLIGPMIIYDPAEPAYFGYDAELILILSDWYHTNYTENEDFYLATGIPPFPNSPLINGKGIYPCAVFPGGFGTLLRTPNCYPERQQRHIFSVQPGRTYRIRVINASALSTFTFSIDGHKLVAIEVDGVALKEPSKKADFAYLIRSIMKDDFVNLFPRTVPNINRFVEDTLLQKATAILSYDSEMTSPTPIASTEPFSYFKYATIPPDSRKSFDLLDDQELSLIPKDDDTAPCHVDIEFVLNIELNLSTERSPRSLFNRSRYVGNHTADPLLIQVVKGVKLKETTNPLYVDTNKVSSGVFIANISTISETTVKRDTVMLDKNSYVVLRFVADNPGVWPLHCHIDWHNTGGMSMTLVEGRDDLVGIEIPEQIQKMCADWKENLSYSEND